MKPPFSITECQIEKHTDTKTRAHGESSNKQYNYKVSGNFDKN